MFQDACVLCKIFQKSGPGPKIGEQYGAPFNEDDWNEANGELSSFAFSVPPCALESSNGRLNTAGQQLAVSDNIGSSLDHCSETNDKIAVGGCGTTSPSVPFDTIHTQQLAEIISCFSTDLLNSVSRDGSLVICFTTLSFVVSAVQHALTPLMCNYIFWGVV